MASHAHTHQDGNIIPVSAAGRVTGVVGEDQICTRAFKAEEGFQHH
jgi:hypothetical protein